MGVFGSSDGDKSKRLEADIAFIKTRLDLIAKQLAGHPQASSQAGLQGLDSKLHAIYTAVVTLQRSHEPSHATPEGLDDLRSDVAHLIERLDGLNASVQSIAQPDTSDRFDSLAQKLDSLASGSGSNVGDRLDAIDARLEQQRDTIVALTDAMRSLVRELGNR